MFNYNPNLSELKISDFLKKSEIGFKENEAVTVNIRPSDNAELINKFNAILKSNNLPGSLYIDISRKWHQERIDVAGVFEALKFAHCKQGLKLSLKGVAWDNDNFLAIKQIATFNRSLIHVNFIEGDNCYHKDTDVDKNIAEITHLCTTNKFVLEHSHLQGLIDSYTQAHSAGIEKNEIFKVLDALDKELNKQVYVNHSVEKRLKKF